MKTINDPEEVSVDERPFVAVNAPTAEEFVTELRVAMLNNPRHVVVSIKVHTWGAGATSRTLFVADLWPRSRIR